MVVAAICIVALVLAGCVVVANRFYVPPDFAEMPILGARPSQAAGPSLRVVSWNIGYAGMGKESDFVLDGGTQERPLSADLVHDNLAKIAQRLGSVRPDIAMLQEVAEASWNTYQIDVLGGLVSTLDTYAYTFGADINTRFVPPPWRVRIGNATFSHVLPASAEARGLALEPTFTYGIFRKGYRMHIMRLSGAERWVLVNIHLSAFDAAEARVRERQLAEVLQFARSEYAAGNRVIIGGDWNMRLVASQFPHATEEKYLFWIRDLPEGVIPEGWTLAVDPSQPTVRTANAPYVAGVNYRLIIDGFLVSPNVSVEEVHTQDLGFEDSDHQPVIATFRAR